MLVELSNTQIILANCLGIPLAHMGISWACEQLPRRIFEKPMPEAPTGPNQIYTRVSGFPKARLTSTEPTYLASFIAETRRGEFAHWLQWIVISLFIVWNPFPANLIILIYALLLNAPCILNLRHTRQRLIGLYRRVT